MDRLKTALSALAVLALLVTGVSVATMPASAASSTSADIVITKRTHASPFGMGTGSGQGIGNNHGDTAGAVFTLHEYTEIMDRSCGAGMTRPYTDAP